MVIFDLNALEAPKSPKSLNEGWFTCICLVHPNQQLFMKNHYLLMSIDFWWMLSFEKHWWRKILHWGVHKPQCYNCKYEAIEYGYKANCEWYSKNISSCNMKDSWLPGWGLSAFSWAKIVKQIEPQMFTPDQWNCHIWQFFTVTGVS